jgi:glycosyltransferase involved in cell wall biosynthesis
MTQMRQAGLDGRIEFVGELSEPELDVQYDQADVFVLPTRYEGYGMVVAEALARGLPVIATDTGGIAELLSGGAGLVVPPDDAAALAEALREAIGKPETREALGVHARQRREYLPSWADAAAVMEAALRKVAG